MSQYYQGALEFIASSEQKADEISRSPEVNLERREGNNFYFYITKETLEQVKLEIEDMKRRLLKIDPSGQPYLKPWPGI